MNGAGEAVAEGVPEGGDGKPDGLDAPRPDAEFVAADRSGAPERHPVLLGEGVGAVRRGTQQRPCRSLSEARRKQAAGGGEVEAECVATNDARVLATSGSIVHTQFSASLSPG